MNTKLFTVVMLTTLFLGVVQGFTVVEGPYERTRAEQTFNMSMVETPARSYTGTGFTDNLPLRIGYEKGAGQAPLSLDSILRGYYRFTEAQDELWYDIEIRYNRSYTVNETSYTVLETDTDNDGYNDTELNWWNETQYWTWLWKPVQGSTLQQGETAIVNYRLYRTPLLGAYSTDFVPRIQTGKGTFDFTEFAFFNTSKEFKHNITQTDSSRELVGPLNGTSPINEGYDSQEHWVYGTWRGTNDEFLDAYHDNATGGGWNTTEVANETTSYCAFQTIPVNSSNCPNAPEKLVGYWTFDQTGNRAWEYIHGLHGTIDAGVTQGESGYLGKAFGFRGGSVNVLVEDDPLLDVNSLTVAAWVNASAPSQDANEGIAGRWSPTQTFSMEYDHSSVGMHCNFKVGGSNNVLSANTPPATDGWHFMACTYDAGDGNFSLYVDGELDATTTIATGGSLASNSPLAIGAINDGGTDPFSGEISDFWYVNRSLSFNEIQSLYALNTGLGPEESQGGGGDTTAPSITIHHPTNTTYSQSTLDLNVTADEAVDVWQTSVDGGANQTFTPNSTVGPVSDGQHGVTVWANDSSGNWGKQTVYFTVSDDDAWINATGDDMRGTLDMVGNTIRNVGYLLLEGLLDMAGNRIVNVGNPQEPQDAATKSYVDERTDSLRVSALWTPTATDPVLNVPEDSGTLDGHDTFTVNTSLTAGTINLSRTASSDGKAIVIKDGAGSTCSNSITIITEGGIPIDGRERIRLTENYESVTLEYSGELEQWGVTNHYDPGGLC